jgi:hypothetical protein
MNSKPLLRTNEKRISRRPLALTTAAVFLVSALFPLVAGIAKHPEGFPKWWGTVDVGLAFLLAAFVVVLLGLARGRVDKQVEEASYNAYRVLIHVIFAMLVVFALFGDRISWSNCLSGLAWRFWLLMYCLPKWFSSLK